jgi:hypothetical protein
MFSRQPQWLICFSPPANHFDSHPKRRFQPYPRFPAKSEFLKSTNLHFFTTRFSANEIRLFTTPFPNWNTACAYTLRSLTQSLWMLIQLISEANPTTTEFSQSGLQEGL